MSQKKVEKYRESKKHREQILAKEKRNKLLGRIAAGVVCLFVVGWVGFSIYSNVTAKDETAGTTYYDMDLDAYNAYRESLSGEN